MSKSLQVINNELKVFVNEASGISNKCRLQLIKLVEKHFFVELPKENFLHVDISLLENGNIMMRDVEYETKEKVSNIEELNDRYVPFQEDVELLLKRKGTNFKELKQRNELLNLLVLFLMLIVAFVIIIYSIRLLLEGDFRGFLWMVFIVGYYFIPTTGHRFQNRLIQAKRYLQSFFKK